MRLSLNFGAVYSKNNFDFKIASKIFLSLGCLTMDLASALVICSDGDVRRRHTDDVLREYYKTLCKELGTTPSFSFEQVESPRKIFKGTLPRAPVV